jgi:integrase
MEWGILTATRAREFLEAECSEIDEGAETWTVPIERMKIKEHRGGKPHVVPLGDRAMEIFQEARKKLGFGRYLFPSPAQPGNPYHSARLTAD